MQGVNPFIPVFGGRYSQITFINYVHEYVQITFNVDAIQRCSFRTSRNSTSHTAVNRLDVVPAACINPSGLTDDEHTIQHKFARQLRGKGSTSWIKVSAGASIPAAHTLVSV